MTTQTTYGPDSSAAEVPAGRLSMVRLIDRRSGQPLRLNGRALTAYSRDPRSAVCALMEGRDAALWAPLIEALPDARGARSGRQ